MSAPKNTYDPVEIAALSPGELQRMQAEALAAIAAASDLAELKTARIAHFGDRAPVTLANAEIGALPPAARAEAGKRIGTVRAAIKQALGERQVELEEDRDRRVLVEEAVDVTLPWDRHVAGARHPVSTVAPR
jgi:phenylalanyl-tRNA synthetase alpha chain